jgi:hypothetical protein
MVLAIHCFLEVSDPLHDRLSRPALSFLDFCFSSAAQALAEYPTLDRTAWTLRWPAQVVLGVSQVFWTQDVIRNIKTGGSKALGVFIEELNGQLRQIVQLVRGKLSKGDRSTLGALVVIDVHARDVVQKMVDVKVEAESDFEYVHSCVLIHVICITFTYENMYGETLG